MLNKQQKMAKSSKPQTQNLDKGEYIKIVDKVIAGGYI